VKTVNIEHDGDMYSVVTSVTSSRLCDVSIYKLRKNRKWYQSRWENFTNFICCPETVDDLKAEILDTIREVSKQMKLNEKFFQEYKKDWGLTFHDQSKGF